MGLFEPSYKEVWQDLASETGAEYKEAGFLRSAIVTLKHKDFDITLDQYTVSSGNSSTTYTRFRVPFYNQNDFRFRIYKKSIFSDLGKKLGMMDLEVGYPDIDDPYIIKGNDQPLINKIFYSDDIRDLILKIDKLNINSTARKKRDSSSYIEYNIPGVVKNKALLKDIFTLFSLLISRYEELGITG